MEGILCVQQVCLTDIFREVLDRGLFPFILEYAALSISDYKFKQSIWLWLRSNQKDNYDVIANVPIAVQNIALSYDKKKL